MQRVNFYFDEYKPKPLSFNSQFALSIFALTFIGLIVIGSILSVEKSDMEKRLAEKQVRFAKLQTEITQLTQKLKQDSEIQALEIELNNSLKMLNQYRKVIGLVKTPQKSQSDIYSQILQELSERKADSIWLTEINIDAQNLSLHGTTTKTDSIPRYVDELKDASSLKRQFDELQITRDGKNNRLINFSLINGKKFDGQ
ncbi:PilN domain-containing protein [Aliikangiella coralliicola]|uniref:PilN domain-containing protein n=1 Tax=Aliikangiella coralliicola TaxID=2592383 RepID=A0A545UGC7_9GAMM|nr:PilN domain-containing protein [Aliikangiella coralliicola]TQV88532.1 hypothetical protein FLL46_08410 [Aliikangiella coralliicola]